MALCMQEVKRLPTPTGKAIQYPYTLCKRTAKPGSDYCYQHPINREINRD